MFAAWSKTLDEERERREARETIENVRTELQELKDAERRRQWEARLGGIGGIAERRLEYRATAFLDVVMELAPAAAILILAYLAQGGTMGGGSAGHSGKMSPRASGTASEEIPKQANADCAQPELIERINAGTATQDEMVALAKTMWRWFHRETS